MLTAAQLTTQQAALESTVTAFNSIVVPACQLQVARLAVLPYSTEATKAILAFNAMVATINAESPKLRKAIEDTKAQMVVAVPLVGAGIGTNED